VNEEVDLDLDSKPRVWRVYKRKHGKRIKNDDKEENKYMLVTI
jgi:hypothetical protein